MNKGVSLRMLPRLVATVTFVAFAAVLFTSDTEHRPAFSMMNDASPVLSFDGMENKRAARTLAGNYLAGRFAQNMQDWDAARHYMAAVNRIDNNNDALEQRVFLLSLGAGAYDETRDMAQDIAARRRDVELADIFLAIDAIRDGDFLAARNHIDRLPDSGFGEYTKPLLGAWTYAGMGMKKRALEILAGYAAPDDPTYNMHAALIEEMSGDDAAATIHFTRAVKNGLTLHTAFLAANFFDRTGNADLARKIRLGIDDLYAFSPFVHGKETRAANRNVTTAAQGAAVALFDLASLLHERRAYDSAQIYGSMVRFLDPASDFATLMLSDLAAIAHYFDKAQAGYDSISRESPLYWLSRIRTAEILEADGRIDDAAAMLAKLSLHAPLRVQALISLGDLYRRNERFAEAIAAYDGAIDGIGKLTADHWAIVYARGMSLERADNWERAEKDLLAALAFQPDNPVVLNYLGYSWLQKDINIDKALEYTRRAALMRPDDGYILDSYGWALFRTGDAPAAVVWLERAVALVPDDSTVLDHLGDAYWQVGRRNEARFKWRRAAEISTDPTFHKAMAQKIRHGIEPAVRAAQRSEPGL